MENNKKNVINCLYAIALFFAVMGAVQLLMNTTNLLFFFKDGIQYHQVAFTRCMTIFCLIATIVSILGLVITFIKKDKSKVIFNIIKIVILAVLLILSCVCIFLIPKVSRQYYPEARLQEFSTSTSMQGMFLQQVLAFGFLWGIRFFEVRGERKPKEKKVKDDENEY